jgi:tellurite resistance protein TerC
MKLREPNGITYRWARRIAVTLVGGTVLAIGVALLVLPGPAFVVIPVGLAILGVEFAWARHWLRKVKQRSSDLLDMFRVGPPGAGPTDRSRGA